RHEGGLFVREVRLSIHEEFVGASHLFKGAVEVALDGAHRATTASSWGLCEQEGHLDAPVSSF
ncbi:MAG: hypothetical protein ACREI1_10470, partial [Nitrospiraceae bacterium]